MHHAISIIKNWTFSSLLRNAYVNETNIRNKDSPAITWNIVAWNKQKNDVYDCKNQYSNNLWITLSVVVHLSVALCSDAYA